MSKIFKMGIIGLGCRGYSVCKDVLVKMPHNVKVVALCDKYEDRIERARELLEDKNVYASTDYKQLLKEADVDCVYISCDWEMHAPIAIEALKEGVAVACEVGGAYTLQECFDLVSTYESTQTPIMFMENCCFDKTETTVENMVKDGLFGELVYCSGAYGHDLREEVTNGTANRHYRERNYMERCCENYPTHELGPIAKILGINKGNRMVSLFSVASKSAGMDEYIRQGKKADAHLKVGDFKQGDVVITNITCENGELITLKLDTSLPRSYHREFAIAGTKGRYTALYDEVFIDGDGEWHKSKPLSDYPQYVPDFWSPEEEKRIKDSGHGGMDYIEFEAFFKALREGEPMPVDVYDMASWMSITPLSEESIREGKMVQIPDFTNGKYKTRG